MFLLPLKYFKLINLQNSLPEMVHSILMALVHSLLRVTEGFPCLVKLDRVLFLHLILQMSGLNPLYRIKIMIHVTV